MRQEMIDWKEVEALTDHLIPQFNTEFDAVLMFSHGGVIPGGMLAEALGTADQQIVRISIPMEFIMEKQRSDPRLIAWPKLLTFPANDWFEGRQILIVGSVWRSGRSMLCVKNRVSGAGGFPHTCVLHYIPGSSLFPDEVPDYYAARTDAWIIYPWEARHGKDLVLSAEG